MDQNDAPAAAMLSIRTAAPRDAATLADAQRRTAMTPGLLASRPDEIRAEAIAQKIEALETKGRFIVAESDGQIVGHALLEPLVNLAATAHVFVLTIVVHPGYTGQGIGTALLGDLLRWAAADARVKRVELRVRSTNAAAIALYRKLGFVEEGRFRERIQLEDGTFVDDVAMAYFPKAPKPEAF
jgi:RimJ/RimL family protein N-acetyltransferase